jgi:hypothetical protein
MKITLKPILTPIQEILYYHRLTAASKKAKRANPHCREGSFIMQSAIWVSKVPGTALVLFTAFRV